MPQFNKGDLVRERRESEDLVNIVIQVERICADGDWVECSVGRSGTLKYFKPEELELVTASQVVHEDVRKPVPVATRLTEAVWHEEVARMYSETVSKVREELPDISCVELTTRTCVYSGNDLDISFGVQLASDQWVYSDSINKSARIAINRNKENELLTTKQIGLVE